MIRSKKGTLAACLALLCCATIAACDRGDKPQWIATGHSVGPVVAGMKISQVEGVMRQTIPRGDTTAGCRMVKLPGAPGHILLMLATDRVVRVDVFDNTVATEEGARVGDAESRIMDMYSGRTVVIQGDSGKLVTVIPKDPQDAVFRIIFEIREKKAHAFRMGLLPFVNWMDVCTY